MVSILSSFCIRSIKVDTLNIIQYFSNIKLHFVLAKKLIHCTLIYIIPKIFILFIMNEYMEFDTEPHYPFSDIEWRWNRRPNSWSSRKLHIAMANCNKVTMPVYTLIYKKYNVRLHFAILNLKLRWYAFIRFDFKIVSRGETDAGYYYEGNDFSQVFLIFCCCFA